MYRFSVSGSDYLNFDLVGDQLVLKKIWKNKSFNLFISNDQRGGEVKRNTIYPRRNEKSSNH
jgi:hypothetical protein